MDFFHSASNGFIANISFEALQLFDIEFRHTQQQTAKKKLGFTSIFGSAVCINCPFDVAPFWWDQPLYRHMKNYNFKCLQRLWCAHG